MSDTRRAFIVISYSCYQFAARTPSLSGGIHMRARYLLSASRETGVHVVEKQSSIVICVATTWKGLVSHLSWTRLRCSRFRLSARCTICHVANQHPQSLIIRLSRVVFRIIGVCIHISQIIWIWTRKNGKRYANLGRKISYFFYVAP